MGKQGKGGMQQAIQGLFGAGAGSAAPARAAQSLGAESMMKGLSGFATRGLPRPLGSARKALNTMMTATERPPEPRSEAGTPPARRRRAGGYRPRTASIIGHDRFASIRCRETAMTDATARAAKLLDTHRASIDRLDAILVYTLAERFKHTQAVGRLKAKHNLPPSDPVREEKQIRRLQDLAGQADLDPEFARRFLAFIIEEVIHHHKQHKP